MIQPLPIQTRPITGESLASFAGRLSAKNGMSVQSVERGLLAAGLLPRVTTWGDSLRQLAWVELGALHEHDWHQLVASPRHTTQLCEACAQGTPAYGELLCLGFLCLKHRRTLGGNQRRVSHIPEFINAERALRRELRRTNEDVYGERFRLSSRLAELGLAPSDRAARTRYLNDARHHLIAYPETVTVFKALNRAALREQELFDLSDSPGLRSFLHQLEEIFPFASPENWRVVV